MAKITISDLTAAFASTTALNAKFQQIEDEFLNKIMYLDETSPMGKDLDMAANEIINLAPPTTPNAAARLQDVQDASSTLTEASALLVSIDDAGGHYTGLEVETALQEVGSDLTLIEADVLSLETASTITTEGVVTASEYVTASASGDVNFPNGTEIQIAGEDLLDEGTWTPNWTSLSVGNGIEIATYTRIDDVVTINYHLTFGSTTAISGGTSFTGLPFAIVGDRLTGSILFLDSPAAYYAGVIECIASQGFVFALNVAGTYGASVTMSSTIPFTWATGDEIMFTLQYKV